MLSPSIGIGEIVVLALLAIIFVGPKDLPKLMRNTGRVMGRIRAMGQEFKDAFNDIGAEDEINAMRREIEELKKLGHLEEELEGMRDIDAMMRGDYRRSAMSGSEDDPIDTDDAVSNCDETGSARGDGDQVGVEISSKEKNSDKKNSDKKKSSKKKSKKNES